MPTDVDSKIGFQTQGAVTALNNLTKALGSYNAQLQRTAKHANTVNAANKRAAASFKALNTSVQSSNAAFSKTQAATKKVNKSLNTVNTNTKRVIDGSKNLTLSWQSVGRIFAQQIALQGLNSIVSGIREGIVAAKDFQIQMAEVKTLIDADVGPSIAQLEDAVLDLSSAFGRSADDVGEGLYEALSNQLTDTENAAIEAATAISFMNDALAFSKATVSSTEDSVNLLSSVIKSYGLEASDAARISDVLFVTIDKGRVRANELANTFGRTLPLAAQLGVEFEEVAASIATLTVQGVKADEAQTLLTNAFLKLLKPTEAMRQAFNRVGVSSAEAGIAAFGFKGFLDELTKSGELTASQIAELTGRVRATRGVIGLTGEAAESYNDTLAAMRESAGRTAEALKIIEDTDADKVNRELTEIKNSLTRIGTETLGGLAKALAFLNDYADVGALAAAALVTLGTAGAFALGVQLVSATKAATASLLGLEAAAISTRATLLTIGKATAAIAAVFLLVSQRQRRVQQQYDLIDAAAKKNKLIAVQESEAQTAEVLKNSNERFESIFRSFAKIRRLYEQDKNAAVAAQRGISVNFNREVDNRISAIQRLVKAVDAVAANSAANIKQISDSFKDFRLDIRLQNFEDAIARLNPAQQGKALLNQSQAFLNAAAKAAASVDTEENAKALGFLQQAEEFARRAAKFAATEFVARQQINKIYQSTFDIQKQLNQLEEERKNEAERVAEALRAQADNVVGILSELKEIQNTDLTKKTSEEVVQLIARADELQKKYTAALDKIDIGSLDAVKALAELREEATKPLQLNVAGNLQDYEKALSDQIRGLTPEVLQKLDALGIKINPTLGLEGIEQGIIDAKKRLQEGAAAARPIVELRVDVETDLSKVNVQLRELELAFEKFTSTPTPITFLQKAGGYYKDEVKLATELNSKIQEAVKLLSQPQNLIQETDLLRAQALISEIEALGATKGGIKSSPIPFVGADSKTATEELATILNRILQARSQINEQAAKTQFQDLTGKAAIEAQEKAINDLEVAFKNNKAAIEQLGPAAAASVETVNPKIESIGTSANNARIQVEELRKSLGFLGGLVPDVPTGNAAGLARGGLAPKYLAQGGFPGRPKGTDQIPAWLSRGEMVINAKSAKQFYSQLQAINAGKQPIYRQEGGPVTNVGDINVTVNNTTTNPVDGRQLATAIRREVRKGTI